MPDATGDAGMLRRRDTEAEHGPVEPDEPGIKETLGPEMTVVGRGTQLEGTLLSAESIRIDGEAKGTIAARGDVILSSHSQVEADIHADNVLMGGALKGNIRARTRTELAAGGRLVGKIRSKLLVVREGAQFSGQSSVDLENAPDEAGEAEYPVDDLWNAYEQATRRAADWYKTRLDRQTAERHNERGVKWDASLLKVDETAPH
jgi:cytoskeletal protein CcmA (bactofilin family)